MSSILSRITDRVSPSTIYWALNTPIGRYLYRRGFTDTRTRTIAFDGIEFRMQTPSNELFLWNDFAENGCHEPITGRAFLNVLNGSESATVWDIGSKCGYFMMVAAQATSASGIHVFEPTRPHVDVVRRNNERYLDDRARVNDTPVGERVDAGMTTGDAYAAQFGPPDLVKIDVDGPEIGVLRGMQRTVEEHEPHLLVEVHTGTDWQHKHRELWGLLPDGYVKRAVGEHRSERVEWQPVGTVDRFGAMGQCRDDFLLRCFPGAGGDGIDHE
jgi:hypothetical protein